MFLDRRIGRAAAARFAEDGDEVVITGRRADVLDRAAKELGDNVRTVVCDGTDLDATRAAIDTFPAQIDVLVNNAGGNTDFDRSDGDDLAEVAAAWRANLDANLLSAVLMTEGVRERLRSGGTIVNIGSIAADKGAGAYGAAKAGLASWTVDLANRLGSAGITVNTLAPGYVADTEFFRDMLPDSKRADLVAASATGRASVPDDIAATVHFLASTGARQITAQVIAVNGGEHATR